MWSYSFEVPSLMILGIILLFYFSRPRLPIRRNISFFKLILVQTLTVFLDVLATVMDNHYDMVRPGLVNLANMFYFIAYFLRSYTLFYFVVTVTRDELEKNIVIRTLLKVPFLFGVGAAVLSAIIGSSECTLVVYYTDSTGYHSGELYPILYLIGFFYIAVSFVSFLLYKGSLGRRREKYGLVLYGLILLVALVIRRCLPTVLLMDTFVVMAILVVYLAFINPEFYLDLRGTSFNTVALREHLEENINHFKLAPIGISIHNFTEMRDIYGVNQMDEAMILIARYIKQVFPKGYLFYCRNGRFVVLAKPGTDFVGGIKAITERFKRPWKNSSAELYLEVGFVDFKMILSKHKPEVFMKTMIRALDKAGKLEKDTSLNITEEDILTTEDENMIRRSIEAAIEGNGFELFLQPIIDSVTGTVVGAEALSRIRDPEGKIIPPGRFIPVAENSGRINELGELVFDRTCRFIKDENFEKMGIEWINVNLSPSQFVRTDLAERYAAIAEKNGVDPQKIHFEITEGATIDDHFLQKQIAAISDKGFKFVLDDYGTGYSNLSRLKKCPFINVKLDMSIVWDYCKHPDAILPNMVRAFKNMGFTITAEGIESENMVDTMKKLGVDFLQGYFYSRPLCTREFAEKYTEER